MEGNPPEFGRYTYAVSGDNIKLEIENLLKSGHRRVVGKNSNYNFGLSREQFSTEYAIQYLDRRDSESTKQRVAEFDSLAEDYKDSIFCSWYLVVRPLVGWFEDPAFRIKSVEPTEISGRQYVRIDFEYVDNVPERKQMLPGSYVVLDPENSWTIRAFKVLRGWGPMEATLTYGDTTDGLPYVKEKVEFAKGPKNQITTTWKFEKLARAELPESAFTVAAYNLHEPSFNNSYNASFKWYIVSSAALGLLIVVLIQVRKKMAVPGNS